MLVSIAGEESMPISEIEALLLGAARDRLQAAGSLSLDSMVRHLNQARRDEAASYSAK